MESSEKNHCYLFSASLTVIVDAIHSLADVASFTIILRAIKISAHPAHSFPYYLYTIKNLVAMATSGPIILPGNHVMILQL